MNTSKSKPLAKVFWPVLLLSAALSLPVDSFAAPSPRERNAQADKADKNEKRANRAERQQRKEARQDRQEKRGQKQEVRQDRQRDQARNRGQEQRAAAQRQAEVNRRAELQRQADLRRQAERSRASQLRANRQAELNRQAALQRQAEQSRRDRHWQAELNRKAQLQRQAELNRQVELQRRANQQRYGVQRDRYNGSGYNDRYRSYAGGNRWNRGDTIAVDGHLTNEGYNCQALRDDNGQLYMLVGNTYGLRNGDHARVVGRVVDGGHCDWEGTAFEITDVTALWADRRHHTVHYHQNYDGGRFGHRDNWMGRHPRAFQNRIR